jgi:hypothetical protein
MFSTYFMMNRGAARRGISLFDTHATQPVAPEQSFERTAYSMVDIGLIPECSYFEDEDARH